MRNLKHGAPKFIVDFSDDKNEGIENKTNENISQTNVRASRGLQNILKVAENAQNESIDLDSEEKK